MSIFLHIHVCTCTSNTSNTETCIVYTNKSHHKVTVITLVMVVSKSRNYVTFIIVSYGIRIMLGVLTVLSGCFCSYSSIKLLYSVVCISITLYCKVGYFHGANFRVMIDIRFSWVKI